MKSVHHLSDVILLIILVLIQTKAFSSVIAQSHINSVCACVRACIQSERHPNGIMNVHSGRLMGSYLRMRVCVLDGIFSRRWGGGCKERGNYSEGFNFQNCL